MKHIRFLATATAALHCALSLPTAVNASQCGDALVYYQMAESELVHTDVYLEESNHDMAVAAYSLAKHDFDVAEHYNDRSCFTGKDAILVNIVEFHNYVVSANFVDGHRVLDPDLAIMRATVRQLESEHADQHYAPLWRKILMYYRAEKELVASDHEADSEAAAARAPMEKIVKDESTDVTAYLAQQPDNVRSLFVGSRVEMPVRDGNDEDFVLIVADSAMYNNNQQAFKEFANTLVAKVFAAHHPEAEISVITTNFETAGGESLGKAFATVAAQQAPTRQ
jgi:hypothetical protein